MLLTPEDFADSVDRLFDPTTDPHNPEQLAESAAAFQNLVFHFIQFRERRLYDYVDFDPVRLGLMLKRFYRDAFAIGKFDEFLHGMVSTGRISDEIYNSVQKAV